MSENELLYALSHSAHVPTHCFRSYVHSLCEGVQWQFIRRTLVRLGHIDELRSPRGRIVVAKPALAELFSDPGRKFKAVLCGARNEQLLEELSRAALDLGVDHHRTSQTQAPDIVTLASESKETLSTFADLMGLNWAGCAAAQLCQVLPTTLLENAGTSWSIESGRYARQWMNPRTGRFQDTQEGNPALCRISGNGLPPVCMYVDDNDVYLVDPHAGRHVVRCAHGGKWIRYDSESAVLSVYGRAPLPSLHERAAVLCSGREPEFKQRWLHYSDVPANLASHIRRTVEHVALA